MAEPISNLLGVTDPEVSDAIQKEEERQRLKLEMIASENFAASFNYPLTHLSIYQILRGWRRYPAAKSDTIERLLNPDT